MAGWGRQVLDVRRDSPTAGHEGVDVKGLVYNGERTVAVEEVDDPRIQEAHVEAVGYQAHDPSGDEHPELVLDNLVKVVRTTGAIGVIGVYMPQDPGAATEGAKQGRIGWDYGTFFTKGQRMGTGQAPVKRYNRELRDLIIAGRAKPGWIGSHELPLEQAPEAYDKFDRRLDGWTKVLLHPAA